MKQASFRFYASLNDFLPPLLRYGPFPHRFWGRPAVKDTIEAIGVPHPEVALILANGDAVDFAYALDNDDRISVYPRFRQLQPDPALLVRPDPPSALRFVLDTHLGKLAAYLRLLGLDVRYARDADDAMLARIARDDERILLTRDLGLLKRSIVQHGYFVRATNPKQQLAEVVRRLDLADHAEPFTRCLDCNTPLETVPKAAIADRLPLETKRHFDVFYYCSTCDQVFWKGSHYERMERFVTKVLSRHSSDHP